MTPPLDPVVLLPAFAPWLDVAGLAVFAASGALAAARRGMTFVTFAFFAVVTGVGGGTVRDLLIGAPVFWVHDSRAAAPFCRRLFPDVGERQGRGLQSGKPAPEAEEQGACGGGGPGGVAEAIRGAARDAAASDP